MMIGAMKIRVLVVDDNPTVRLSLRRGFASQKDIEVVGEAADGEEVIAIAQRIPADVIVMDVHMPKLSGVDATKKLRALGIDTPVLMLTADARVERRVRRMKGVRFLLKGDAGLADTVKAVRAAAGSS